ncbi:hypothetical protein R3P38DRAFT_3225579 [Favolaschia claudopus]|uniref:Gag protein n=1 Tax=Favolaschia claudopus TaxID=2862362 RepID=A0AAV9ZUM8_9AGAR
MPLELIKAKAITDAFLYTGIQEYVLGEISKPAESHSDFPIWKKNDNLARAGIRMHISEGEKAYLRSCTIASASDIWTELKTRHRQKTATQTSLLDDVLSIRIDRDADMVKNAARIREICTQIFEIGTLDEHKLARVILLHALSPELSNTRDKHEDSETSTPADIVASLEKVKLRWEEEMKGVERANAARTSTKPQTANTKGRLCGTCSGKHRTDDCWAEGGAMEGRRDEVIERRAARRKDKDSKQTEKPANTTDTKSASKPKFTMKDALSLSDVDSTVSPGSHQVLHLSIVNADQDVRIVMSSSSEAPLDPDHGDSGNLQLEELCLAQKRSSLHVTVLDLRIAELKYESHKKTGVALEKSGVALQKGINTIRQKVEQMQLWPPLLVELVVRILWLAMVERGKIGPDLQELAKLTRDPVERRHAIQGGHTLSLATRESPTRPTA